MTALALDPTREEYCREDVVNALRDLELMFGDLRGADQKQIDLVRERLGMARLPVAVDEYMRIIGADDDVCRHMFPGVSGLSVRAVLRSELDWVVKGGRIPYSVADVVLWLGPADPPSYVDVYDPVVWTLRGGADAPSAGGRFVADLERRVEAGLTSLRRLRQYVEACGFYAMEDEGIEAYAAAKSAGHRKSMERLLSTRFDDDLFDRMKVMIVESINRDVALYRRMKPQLETAQV